MYSHNSGAEPQVKSKPHYQSISFCKFQLITIVSFTITIEKGQFDVKQGKLVTVEICSRCGKQRNLLS